MDTSVELAHKLQQERNAVYSSHEAYCAKMQPIKKQIMQFLKGMHDEADLEPLSTLAYQHRFWAWDDEYDYKIFLKAVEIGFDKPIEILIDAGVVEVNRANILFAKQRGCKSIAHTMLDQWYSDHWEIKPTRQEIEDGHYEYE